MRPLVGDGPVIGVTVDRYRLVGGRQGPAHADGRGKAGRRLYGALPGISGVRRLAVCSDPETAG
jgi:hypothetical protein